MGREGGTREEGRKGEGEEWGRKGMGWGTREEGRKGKGEEWGGEQEKREGEEWGWGQGKRRGMREERKGEEEEEKKGEEEECRKVTREEREGEEWGRGTEKREGKGKGHSLFSRSNTYLMGHSMAESAWVTWNSACPTVSGVVLYVSSLPRVEEEAGLGENWSYSGSSQDPHPQECLLSIGE